MARPAVERETSDDGGERAMVAQGSEVATVVTVVNAGPREEQVIEEKRLVAIIVRIEGWLRLAPVFFTRAAVVPARVAGAESDRRLMLATGESVALDRTRVMIEKIVSGGQTGADRAALDVAIRYGLAHGGWCPRGRISEDGTIGGQYQLTETPSADSSQRTEWNVRDSDGTAVFTLGAKPAGGSLLTIELAAKLGKPCLHLSVSGESYDDRALILRQFVTENRIVALNVAGSRESEEPGIYSWVWRILEDAFFWSENRPNLLGGPGE